MELHLYQVDEKSEDLKISTFHAELPDERKISLKIAIGHVAHELLPDVYNLAFGPLDQSGHIDDKVQLSYKDYSKVFSTILFAGLTYLDNNRDHFIGIDGSNNAREGNIRIAPFLEIY